MKISELEYGVCYLSVIPMMDRPEASSLMISQMLYGEFVQIKAKARYGWIKVISVIDRCEGYVRVGQIIRISKEEFEKSNKNTAVVLERCDAVFSNDSNQAVLLGSTLSNFDGISFKLYQDRLRYSGHVNVPDPASIPHDFFIKITKLFLYSPLLRGGRSVFGIDGAAFIQLVFQMVGIHLYRDARSQIMQGQNVDFVTEARWGDIAFFENEQGFVNHCGILLDDHRIIHVGNFVRIDLIDHHGIYNRDTRKYTHELRLVKRVIET